MGVPKNREPRLESEIFVGKYISCCFSKYTDDIKCLPIKITQLSGKKKRDRLDNLLAYNMQLMAFP